MKHACFILAFWFVLLCAQVDAASLDNLKQRLASPDYETRKSAVSDLVQVGQTRKLTKQEIDLLLPHLKSDADWRIKVRITAVLPHAENTEWVLTPLLEALKDRDDASSGKGNVPSSACKSLARLGDARALKPMQEWLQFLQTNPEVYGNLRATYVQGAQKSIAELEAKLKQKALTDH
jgi:HEAT repeat protein